MSCANNDRRCVPSSKEERWRFDKDNLPPYVVDQYLQHYLKEMTGHPYVARESMEYL